MGVIGFPNPVNETSARLVAAGVVLQVALFLVLREGWLLVPLAYGFVARVLTGPRLSPLGWFVTHVVTPRLHGEHRFVPGPPKRFAQGVGVVFSVGASIAWWLGSPPVAIVLISMLGIAASLEAFGGICLGCIVFARLMHWGLVPESVCADCADLSGRRRRESARATT
jgi:hypothetical protein